MPEKASPPTSPPDLTQQALSRWDHEGRARFNGPPDGEDPAPASPETPVLTNSELVQLRIRVIALENLVIAMLAQASEAQLQTARSMAAYIAPRPGFTHHPLTIRASAQMIDLVHRAAHFRSVQP
jgi:hypothetical protein